MPSTPARRKHRIPYENRNLDWKVAIVGTKLFLYWKGSMMPTYTFVKTEGKWWIGHGFRDISVRSVIEWVRSQPEPGT